MKKSERFALNQWLSDYPDGLTYDEIIQRLENDPNAWRVEDITPWVLVETFPLGAIAEFIDTTQRALECEFSDAWREEGAK